MSALTVTVAESRWDLASEVVSSLPVSYVVHEDDGQILVIDGSIHWPVLARTAVERGLTGVIVTDPTAAPSSEIRSLAEVASTLGTPVLLSESWAGNPTILGAGHRWRGSLATARTIECFAVEPVDGADDAALVLRQLRVLRRLGVSGIHLRDAAGTSRASSRIGVTGDGAIVSLLGVRSSAIETAVEIVVTGPDDTVSVRLTSARTARPASARRLTASGGELLPTIYETAHRATFLRMHEVITTGAHVDELTGFIEDVETAEGRTNS